MNDTTEKRERVTITHPLATDLLFALFGADSNPQDNIHGLGKAQDVSEQVVRRFQPLALAARKSALVRNQLIAYLEKTPPADDDITANAQHEMEGVMLFYRTFIDGFYVATHAATIKAWATPERVDALTKLLNLLELDPNQATSADAAYVAAMTPGTAALLALALGDVIAANATDPIGQFLKALLNRGAPAEGPGGGIANGAVDGAALSAAFGAFGNRRQPGDLEDVDGEDDDTDGGFHH